MRRFFGIATSTIYAVLRRFVVPAALDPGSPGVSSQLLRDHATSLLLPTQGVEDAHSSLPFHAHGAICGALVVRLIIRDVPAPARSDLQVLPQLSSGANEVADPTFGRVRTSLEIPNEIAISTVILKFLLYLRSKVKPTSSGFDGHNTREILLLHYFAAKGICLVNLRIRIRRLTRMVPRLEHFEILAYELFRAASLPMAYLAAIGCQDAMAAGYRNFESNVHGYMLS